MAVAMVEMAPKVFPLTDVTGAFATNDVVMLRGPKGDLRGVVHSASPVRMAGHRNPPLGVKIAINRGDVSEFKNGGFGGYLVTSSAGATGTVIEPPLLTYAGRVLKQLELQKMLDTAESLIVKAARYKSDEKARKWFGTKATSRDELAKIHRRCAELQQGVAGLSSVIFQCTNGETMGGIATTDPLRGGPTCRIQIGRGVTYDRYSWGERVCTIVHELTHWFLDTEDAVNKWGVDAYGIECLKLADSDEECGKVLNNADNWAFYICEYRGEGEAGDWRNFSEQELRLRPRFVSGAYNVDQSLIARYN
jgi:Lysine-specific metallo-endopeptidase